MHTKSMLFEKCARALFLPRMSVLEVGPDGAPSTCEKRVDDPTPVWETLEIRRAERPLSAVTHIAEDEYRFPIASDSFDIVLACQVIEHVRKIWLWMHELRHICRPGGNVILICPVSWPYHEDPVDCWRIYPDGMRALCEEAGLQLVTVARESLEPRLDLRRKRWFLAKQVAKAFIGREPFMAPLTAAWAPTLDTIAIGRKP